MSLAVEPTRAELCPARSGSWSDSSHLSMLDPQSQFGLCGRPPQWCTDVIRPRAPVRRLSYWCSDGSLMLGIRGSVAVAARLPAARHRLRSPWNQATEWMRAFAHEIALT